MQFIVRLCLLGWLTLAATGCGSATQARHVLPEPAATEKQTHPTPMAESPAVPVPVSIVADGALVSGTGEHESEPFLLHSGPVLFQIEHATATFFAAFLLNANGDHLAVLANATVPLSGPQFIGNDVAGEYHLHVIAEDSWQVTVTQPADPRDVVPPVSDEVFDGDGLAIASLDLAAGKQELTWRHAGTYPLALTLWSLDGKTIGKVVFNGGVPNGSAAFDVAQAGTYLLNIQADGPWSVALVGSS